MSDDAGLGVALEFEGFRGDAMHNPWPPYYQIIIAKCISKTWHTRTPLFFASLWLWYAARILRDWRTSGRPDILGVGSVAVVITLLLCRRSRAQRQFLPPMRMRSEGVCVCVRVRVCVHRPTSGFRTTRARKTSDCAYSITTRELNHSTIPFNFLVQHKKYWESQYRFIECTQQTFRVCVHFH